MTEREGRGRDCHSAKSPHSEFEKLIQAEGERESAVAFTQVLIVLKWKNNSIHRHGVRAGWFNKQAPICQLRRQKSIYIINTRMFLLLCERKSIWAPGWRASDKTQQAFTSTRRFPRSPGQFCSTVVTGTRYLLVISVASYTTRRCLPLKALLFMNPGFGSVRCVTDLEKGLRFGVPVWCLPKSILYR